MNVTKQNHKNMPFGMIVSSEKFKYLENGTIFFQMACVEIYQTLAPITYIKTTQIETEIIYFIL